MVDIFVWLTSVFLKKGDYFKMIEKKYELVKFKDDDFELDVNVSPSEETVWLTIEQMAKLFNRDRSVISKHITNIFGENELDSKSNVHFLHIANSDKPDRKSVV